MSPTPASPLEWARAGVPEPQWTGGNRVRLLQGGAELFPAMLSALAAARHEIWLATYILHDDGAAQELVRALSAAARRGVVVRVVVDGFGSIQTLPRLRQWWADVPVQLEVFRPLERWWQWMRPGHLRRLHQKLCVVDEDLAFVSGINLIDDCNDLQHGWSPNPRLDFAVEIRGPLAAAVRQTASAVWARARLGHDWRREVGLLVRGERPVREALDLLRNVSGRASAPAPDPLPQPVRAAFIVRDNLGQRRAIERSYVRAIRMATRRVDIACPYFYPGRAFLRTLRHAARRGVQVRLLLQGKIDFRIAALAARVLYDELRSHGVQIYEYTPAFLHAKVALVDDHWATVGSSNIDPMSLLLNLEANVVVDDPQFVQTLAERLETAFAAASVVQEPPVNAGWRRWLARGFVAWCATLYLRLAGFAGRY